MKKTLLLTTLMLAFSGIMWANSYVGPEKCLSCHNNSTIGDATGWRTSMHANGYSVVLDDAHTMEYLYGVINDYDQNGVDDFHDGLDFNTISSAFDPYKPNAPVLAYSDSTGYTITMGTVTYRVYLTYGGSGLYKQRYGVKINTSEGETDGIYISPIQFNETTHEYVLYHAGDWYDGSNMPIYDGATLLSEAATNGRSLSKGCAGCHVTGLEMTMNESGEWIAHGGAIDPTTVSSYGNNIFDLDGDGTMEQINVGCERCHGPGFDHASTGDKTKIINPEDLRAEEANNICGMCHSRGKSLPNNTFSFPFNDTDTTSWAVGDLVADFYSDGGGYWGDGVQSKKHHQQFYDFYKSSKPTFQFHMVRCFECHDVHNTRKHHITESIWEEDTSGTPIEIMTDNDNNSLCLACHSTHGYFESISKEMVADYANSETDIAAVVTNHSNHTWDPMGDNGTGGASRCSKCHNPKMAKSAVAYDIHSHTFDPVSPEKTLEYDMPNACAVSCHNKNGYTFGVDMSGDTFSDWSEQSDKDLAEKLLFWYENMWFDEQNDNENSVDALKATTAPTLDGDDSDWSGTYATIPLANDRSIDVQATYTDTDLYMLFKWADSTASFTRGAWTYDGSAWSVVSGQSEDRLAVAFNMTVPEEDWLSRGCMNKCHRNVDNKDANQDSTTSEDDAYLATGKMDMWHMKAARSLGVNTASGSNIVVDAASHQVTGGTVTLSGYCDDKYIGQYDSNNAPDGGRYGDAGSSTYSRNRNAAKDGPKYIETAPTDFMDAMFLTQAEIDGGEAVEVSTLSGTDLQAAWDVYASFDAAVPERVVTAPSGSRGDVMQAAKWSDGYWVSEFKRALDTGNSDDDAAFSENNSYTFGMALMDNGGGEDHWTNGRTLAVLNLGGTAIVESNGKIPTSYSLGQNYPNPFNPTTNIKYALPVSGKTTINIYNVLGQKISTVVNRYQNAGTYKLEIDGSKLASGFYFVRMKSGDFSKTQKIVLMK